ncbi:CopG family transcriptional regulator [Serratia fonticola]|uniref:ribbon-helix-helix domain-containing protein n=1 Tax=Serratia fonticola TaxID=47917 RepID=UPI000BA24B81|nr:CopG family transcriptional regulator [Serratia fonticola]PAA97733.1 hypothetical protein CJJ13_08890 [Serratia fonticola]
MDFNVENQDSDVDQQSLPLKVMLPENLLADLNLFAKYFGRSKTEIVRDAIASFMNTQPVWAARSYFFQPTDDVRIGSPNDLLTRLENAPKGTLIKVANLNIDSPDRANILICNLIRVKGREISFEIPNNYRATPMVYNNTRDSNSVKMVAGSLVIPKLDNFKPAFGHETQRYVFTIDVDYVWDIDTSTPSFTGLF